MSGLIEGLVALTGNLEAKGRHDEAKINEILFEFDRGLSGSGRGVEIRVQFNFRNYLDVVIICDGLKFRCFKRNKWYRTNDQFVRHQLLKGVDGRKEDINNLLGFVYRPFDSENDIEIEPGEQPVWFNKQAWEDGLV